MEAESYGENTAYTSMFFFLLIFAKLIRNFQFHAQMAAKNGKLTCVKMIILSPQYPVVATMEVRGISRVWQAGHVPWAPLAGDAIWLGII
jgi:hypothetical protein